MVGSGFWTPGTPNALPSHPCMDRCTWMIFKITSIV